MRLSTTRVRLAAAMCLAVAAALVPSTGARAATASNVELKFLQKLNVGRAGVSRPPLVMHAGLRTAARNWSSSMAASNSLAHGNSGARINAATPDPVEADGPPDNGFAGWCENIAYNSLSQSATDDEVAQMFYNQWFNSTTGHKECMLSLSPSNFGQNVIGVGIVYDSADGRWWGTIDVVKDNTPPPQWVRYEQTASAVTYSGTWATLSNSLASAGSYRRSGTAGSYARFRCNCTGVRWIAEQTPSGGMADVLIDGVRVLTVDQYSSTTRWARSLFTRTGLAPGTHTLEIRVKGTRNASSGGFQTYVDAFERAP